MSRKDQEIQTLNRDKALISHANVVSKLFYDTGICMAALGLFNDPSFGKRIEPMTKQMDVEVSELGKIASGDPDLEERVRHIREITSTGIATVGEQLKLIEDKTADVETVKNFQFYRKMRDNADALQDELRALTENARRTQASSGSGKNGHHSKRLFAIFACLNILIALFQATMIYRLVNRPKSN